MTPEDPDITAARALLQEVKAEVPARAGKGEIKSGKERFSRKKKIADLDKQVDELCFTLAKARSGDPEGADLE